MTDAARPLTEYEAFAARRGGELELRAPDGPPAPARLTAVTLTDPPTGSFTVELRCGPGLAGSQGIYLLRDARTEEVPVFLVPSGGDADGTTFHAVFNFATAPTTTPPSAHEEDHS